MIEADAEDEVIGWFELNDDGEDRCSEVDQRFLILLRDRAVADEWSCDPEDTMAFHIHNGDRGNLEVVMSLDDNDLPCHLFAFGIVFDGSRIVGDRVDGQTYRFHEPTSKAIEFTGTPEYLAERAVEWFESILSWPIVRNEWIMYDRVIYREWAPARSGTAFLGTSNKRPGGPPDRIVHVRGEDPGPDALDRGKWRP